MNRPLYGWKPPTAATDHLSEIDAREAAERAAQAGDQRLRRSRDWLQRYLAVKGTNLNRPEIPSATITEETNDEETITEAAEVSADEGVGDATGKGRGEAGAGGEDEVHLASDAAGGGPSFTDTPF